VLLNLKSHCPELGFLLHKHPAKVHTKETNFGQVHVLYPNPTEALLLLEIDPLALTKRGGGHAFALKPYVNDRCYVASSFLSVALNQMFRTAMAGRCNKKPELVEKPLNLEVFLPALPSRGGAHLLHRLFEPLGYEVSAESTPLDPEFPHWGNSVYYETTLKIETPLYKLLRHLYILMPVLDNEKHYWVGQDEVEKLLHKGEEWLGDHPERELIASRYLKHRRSLAREALSALDPERLEDKAHAEETTERKLGLHQLRLERVTEKLVKSGATRVADLGCGEGKLVRHLLKERQFRKILAMDVALESLQRAERNLEREHEAKRQRVELLHGSLLYTDQRLHQVDAACLVEVIEHLDQERLARAAHNLFAEIRPQTLIVTTPNREYNAVWENLSGGKFRHPDHRFEWTREEFENWAESVRGDYEVTIEGVGEEHPEFGCPSQMAVFQK